MRKKLIFLLLPVLLLTACSGTAETPFSGTEIPVSTESVTEPPRADLMRGRIFDIHGATLVHTVIDEDSGRGYRQYDTASEAFSNLLTDYAGGLDTFYSDTLRMQNPSQTSYYDEIGRSVRLTLDASVQNAVYKVLKTYQITGGVVVMRTDGSIMALVSTPGFDPADLQNMPAGSANHRALTASAPGSAMKMTSCVLAQKYGIGTLTDSDTWNSIHNWDSDSAGSYSRQRSNIEAFIFSSNVYYAKAFDIIGAEAVMQDMKAYFGLKNADLVTDFGTFPLNLGIYQHDANTLRRASFGQGNVRMPLVYLASVTRQVMTDGAFISPWMLSAVVDTNDCETILIPYDAPAPSAFVPEEYLSDVREGMCGVGAKLNVTLPEDSWELYAKTGTAETGGEDYLYLCGYVTDTAEQSYIVCLKVENSSELFFSYAKDTAPVYEAILRSFLPYSEA